MPLRWLENSGTSSRANVGTMTFLAKFARTSREEADEQIEHGVAPEPVGPEAFVPVSGTRYRARRAKSGSASPSAPAAPTCSA